MKPLEQLVNIEKARLLHDLFPSEMPELISYAESLCEFIQQDKEQLREKWNNPILTLDMWVKLAAEVEHTIKNYGVRLHKQSRLFSEQLFAGYLAIVMSHCLHIYITTQRRGNRKFSLAIDLLFGVDTPDQE